jgi:hypothetical protein
MTSMIKQGFSLLFFLGILWGATAQSTTGSAYNAFGIGGLQPIGIGAYSSTGFTGIASRMSTAVNLENPAGLTSIFGPTHVFDLDLSISHLNQTSDFDSFSTTIGGLVGMNLWMKSGDKSAVSFGLAQFSDGRYNVVDTYTNSSLIDAYSVQYQGSGGLSQLYMAYGKQLGRYLNVGVKGSLIFGNISNSQRLYGNDLVDGVMISETAGVGKFIWDAGLQYTIPLGSTSSITLGATYQPSFVLEYEVEQSIIREGYDSLKEENDRTMILPQGYGVGLQLALRKWTVSMDGAFDKWGVNGERESFDYVDQYGFSTGVTYQNTENLEKYMNRVILRMGYGYESGYTNVLGRSYDMKQFNIGIGLPVNRNFGYVNLGYTYSQQGEASTVLLLEEMHTISLNISIRDLWFTRQVYD